jgi:AcrR family transcriptional regulator
VTVSNTSQKPIDKRAQRTRQALADALMALAPQEGFDALEVSKLAATAGIGRSTFYKHFADKDDFLINSFAGMIAGFDAQAQKRRSDYCSMLPAHEVFEHVEGARTFALALATSGQYARTQAAREYRLRIVAEANLARLREHLSPAQRTEIAVILAGAFASLMRWWIEGGMRHSASYVAGLYETVATRILEGETKS